MTGEKVPKERVDEQVALASYFIEKASNCQDVSDRYFYQRQAELHLEMCKVILAEVAVVTFEMKRMSFHG